MALDATVGGPNANSFLTRARGDALAADLLYMDGYTSASEADRDKALIMGTQRIVAVTCWTGVPTTAEQALPWPRTGMVGRTGAIIPSNIIPLEVEMATLRMAVKLLNSDITADNEAATQGLSRVKAGPVEVEWKDTIDAFQSHPLDRHGIESVLPNDVLALLPPSWLCPKASDRGLWVL